MEQCGRTDAEIAARAAAIGESLDDELRASSFAGTPGELVEKFSKLQQAGASRLYLRVSDLTDLDLLELIATEVARQLP
jgi:hypothetical protein